MADFNLDDNFLNQVGLGDLSEEEKKYFREYAVQTLQLRIGTKLSEGLSEEQMKQLEAMVEKPSDSAEEAAKKQQAVAEWLQANHPNYAQLVDEEATRLKEAMLRNAGNLEAVLD